MNHTPRPRLLAAAVLGSAILGAAYRLAHRQGARAQAGFIREGQQQFLGTVAKHVELRSGWAQFEDAGPARQVQMLQQHAWVALWVAGYRSRALSLAEIRTAAKAMFATEPGAAFWQWAHHWYGDLACDTRTLRVYEVLDEVYADETGETVSNF
ncbi:DUF6082 family protein [Streptomyces sp. NPDC051561]|uniref:DUF6082 family protein n=1 Tax=Streptomyces sp. NPDC051561 TaxID=3365658 RepID=UPI00378E10D1